MGYHQEAGTEADEARKQKIKYTEDMACKHNEGSRSRRSEIHSDVVILHDMQSPWKPPLILVMQITL